MTRPSFPSFSRRRFLQLLAAGALGTSGLFGYARRLEPNWLDVETVTLPIRGLPNVHDEMRIVQLSDIHLSQFTSVEKLTHAVDIMNRLTPDLVLLTGDYVGDRAQDAADLVDAFRALNAPSYAVLGNHDLWTDRDVVGKYLIEGNVHLLLNESIEIAPRLYLAGVDDIWSGRPDLQTAMSDVPEKATTLLLVHEPDFFDDVLRTHAPIAVQFSGHSHGGQVRIPSFFTIDGAERSSHAPILPRYGQRYPIGLRRVGSRHVYTNRGLGVWPLPYRFNCRPEITLFRLQPES